MENIASRFISSSRLIDTVRTTSVSAVHAARASGLETGAARQGSAELHEGAGHLVADGGAAALVVDGSGCGVVVGCCGVGGVCWVCVVGAGVGASSCAAAEHFDGGWFGWEVICVCVKGG